MLWAAAGMGDANRPASTEAFKKILGNDDKRSWIAELLGTVGLPATETAPTCQPFGRRGLDIGALQSRRGDRSRYKFSRATAQRVMDRVWTKNRQEPLEKIIALH